MNIARFLKDYSAANMECRPREIRFFGSAYRDENGGFMSLCASMRIEDGDIEGVLKAIIEEGGIGQTSDDGVFRFMPWPCAALEIRNL